jgi:hypothetical protein
LRISILIPATHRAVVCTLVRDHICNVPPPRGDTAHRGEPRDQWRVAQPSEGALIEPEPLWRRAEVRRRQIYAKRLRSFLLACEQEMMLDAAPSCKRVGTGRDRSHPTQRNQKADSQFQPWRLDVSFCLIGNGLLFLFGGTVAPLFASLCAPRAACLTTFCAARASFLTPFRTRLRRLSGWRGGRRLGGSIRHHQNCRRGYKSKHSCVFKKSKSTSTTDQLRIRTFTHIKVCCPLAHRPNCRKWVLI